jgi:S-adenosylmethionine decarboxylase
MAKNLSEVTNTALEKNQEEALEAVIKQQSTLEGLSPFEGSEKLFEIWFEIPDNWNEKWHDGKNKNGLRNIGRDEWQDMLTLVKCKILNAVSNEYCDSYLLSESSLFVWNAKLILKTCGTTTLLYAIPKLLEIASKQGLTNVQNVFYSRKRYMFPQQQNEMHSFFNNEVDFLDTIFEDGSAYIMGRLNGDHWNLFLTEKSSSGEKTNSKPDRTIEVLMNELDQNKMAAFFKSAKIQSAKDAREKSGIDKFFPDAILDDFLFDPCGYSVNGLMGKYYYTIHITPQSDFSYVSFETNIPYDSYDTLIGTVVSTFNPGHFIISLVDNETVTSMHEKIGRWENDAGNYKRGAKTVYQFDDYNLLFVSHDKQGTKSPKIGTPSPVRAAAKVGSK